MKGTLSLLKTHHGILATVLSCGLFVLYLGSVSNSSKASLNARTSATSTLRVAGKDELQRLSVPEPLTAGVERVSSQQSTKLDIPNEVQNTKAAAMAAVINKLASLTQQSNLQIDEYNKTLREIKKRLEEAEKRALEQSKLADLSREKVKTLTEANSLRFKRILSAAEADKQQLSKVLAMNPEWLHKRREKIATQPSRGVVVAAGGRTLLANAFVHLHVLQHHIGCKLPVTLMYWGDDEFISNSTRKYFKDNLININIVDSSQLEYPQHQRPLAPRTLDGRFFGWKPKIAAIYNAPYQQVLFLDADAMPLLDPSFLFDWPDFSKTGSLFFPEHYAQEVELFKYFGLHNPWRDGTEKNASTAKVEPPLQTESGQLLLDRARHADMLEWLWFLNTHDEVTYSVARGDKDTFRAAFDLAGKSESFYQVPCRNADALSKPPEDKNAKFSKMGIVQLAPNGSMAFLHRVWFTKYNTQEWTSRSFDFVTVQMSEGRARISKKYWGLPTELAMVLAPEKCLLDAYEVFGSQQACGVDVDGQDAPVPVFPVPPTSYVARAQQAADAIFAHLKVTVKAGNVQLG